MRELNIIIENIISFLFTLLTATVFWRIIAKYLLHEPSIIAKELSHFLLVWLAGVGFIHFLIEKSPALADKVKNKFHPFHLKKINSIIFIFRLVGLFAIVSGSYIVLNSLYSFEHSSQLGIPYFVYFIIVPIIGGAFILMAEYLKRWR